MMLGGQMAGSHLTHTAGSNRQRAVLKSGLWPNTGDPSTSLQRGLADTLKILNILHYLSYLNKVLKHHSTSQYVLYGTSISKRM